MTILHTFLKGLERFLTVVANQIGALEEEDHVDKTAKKGIRDDGNMVVSRKPQNKEEEEEEEAEEEENSCEYQHYDGTLHWNWSQDESSFIEYHQKVVLGRLQGYVMSRIVKPILPDNWRGLLNSLLEMTAVDTNSSSDDNKYYNSGGDNLFYQLWSSIDAYFLRSRITPRPEMIMDNKDKGLPHTCWKLCLMQCVLLSNTGIVSQLAKYSIRSREHATHVNNLLNDSNLLKEILHNGGPKNQMYGNMLDIYHNILRVSHRARSGVVCNDIFHRLALATALEHAMPIHVFDTQIVIDPVERFQYYEHAYMNHQDREELLDPYFSTLSTFELRMVVNCDASNEEMTWCREMLFNYRPDHIFDRSDQWKYCMIVKSDVRYKQPEWSPGVPRTYQQLISGGGKCGPRAWFGRFVCKSFGVPTWGIRQPGHAAMSRWSPSGWYICLGGPNWKKSYWENQRGEDFGVDVKARECVELYNIVFWLECFAAVCLDAKQKQFWMNLSKLRKRDIATSFTGMRPRFPERLVAKTQDKSRNNSKIYGLDSDSDACGGQIVLTAVSSITHASNKVIFMNGVQQQENHGSKSIVHLIEDGSVSYEISLNRDTVYSLVAHVVTVHSNPSPLRLQVVNEESKVDYEIKIPYTKGYVGETEKIQIELRTGLNTIRFYRQSGLGLTIQKIVLNSGHKFM